MQSIVDEKSSFCDLRQPSVDEILADCGVFRIVLVMGGNSSFRVQHILSADLTVAADILTQREMVQIECQVYSLSANMLNGIARLVYTFGDALKDETFKEKVGEMSVKLLSRTAKERRPGSMGYAEAMLLAYNRKCKYPLKWTKLYEKNVGNNEGLDIDTDMDEDEGGDSFEGAAKE